MIVPQSLPEVCLDGWKRKDVLHKICAGNLKQSQCLGCKLEIKQ